MVKKIFQLSGNIFIAGASGMVGSAIHRKLKMDGYGSKIDNSKLLTPTSKELNLLNKNEVDEWFIKNKPSIVILAAAKVGGIYANSTNPVDFILNNLKIQTNVIEASWRNNVKRFLFLGSSCIYPKLAEQPIKEESLLSGFLESTNEPYAIAKISGIKLCQALRSQYGFDAISLMPTNLYGPGDNYHESESHVMAALIRKFYLAVKNSKKKVVCWGTGSPLREFLHVDDLAKASIFALENWDPNYIESPKTNDGESLTYLNVGCGKDISIFELANKIAFQSGFEGEIIWDNSKPDGTPKKQLNIDRITNLGWSPDINLDQGIKNTLVEFGKLI